MAANPLFEKSTLPYQSPPFDKIKAEHFAPAFDRGMQENTEEIARIKSNPEPPTFENTVVALELSGRLLARSTMVFQNLCAADTTDELQKIGEDYAAKFAAHRDATFLDSDLYTRVKAVFDNRGSLTGEDHRLVEYYNKEFCKAGANLDETNKAKLKEINERLATLQMEFLKKIMNTRKTASLIVDTVEELDGLSEDEIATAKKEAEDLGHAGKYALIIVNTTQQPLMTSLKNRETRRRLYEASTTRAVRGDDSDTRATILETARLRLRKAKLLGKKCFAEWQLQGQMADPASAEALLRDMGKAAAVKGKREAENIQALIKAQGGDFELAPWDWSFYAEQVRKEKFDLDDNEVKPYFELDNVIEKGIFYAAEQLYGVTMKPRTDLPSYHPDVRTYEMLDADGSPLSIFCLDPYARASKRGGAWMTWYVEQANALDNQRPVVHNVLNLVKPGEGKPTLLGPWNVTTVFHEFGHGLHGMLSNLKYPSLAGPNVAADFLEFPSQVNEHWSTYDKVLQNYAVHHQTGEPMPQNLIDRMKAASTYGGGFDTLEVVKAAYLDLYWHLVTEESKIQSVEQMEADAMAAFGVGLEVIPPRYFSSFFLHSFCGDYASNYYVYQWARVLDCDGFEWFLENGGLTRANGDHLRECVLSVGNSVDANIAYEKFAGRKATMKAFLKIRGLLDD